MKKHTIFALVALTLAITSCGKKDWTCTCKSVSSGPDQTFNFEQMKKKDAKSHCDAKPSTFAVTDCKLN